MARVSAGSLQALDNLRILAHIVSTVDSGNDRSCSEQISIQIDGAGRDGFGCVGGQIYPEIVIQEWRG